MAAVAIDQFVESIREPGTSNLSPSRLAMRFGLEQQDLAALARVHRNTLRLHPESARVQASLRDILRVLSAAAEVQPDVERAMFLIKNAPIATFGHRPLLEVVREGRADDAVEYLRSVSAGFVG